MALPTMAQCEDIALRLGRMGGFVNMSYRLFPNTRNSFSPNYMQLGFNFEETRQVTVNTELRFQLFPQDLVAPLRKVLEDLRAECHRADDGPFHYTGDPFLTHDEIETFYGRTERARRHIRAVLKAELLDNYDVMRRRAHDELRSTMQTLLPHLGVTNSSQVLDQSWFDSIFPSRQTLSDDFHLRIRVFNAHPRELMEDARLRREIEVYLDQPQQISLFEGLG